MKIDTGTLVSWVATALTLTGVWIAAKQRIGWMLGVVAEATWVIAALLLHVYALLPLSVIFIFVYSRNYFADNRRTT